MYHPFQGGEAVEVRFVASSETKELTLVWSDLGKGRLHRYIVDVKLVGGWVAAVVLSLSLSLSLVRTYRHHWHATARLTVTLLFTNTTP